MQQQKPTQSSTQYTNTMKAIQSYQDAIQTLQQGGSI